MRRRNTAPQRSGGSVRPSRDVRPGVLGWPQSKGDIVKRMLLVIGVAAALALSACGSSPAAKKAALKDYVASLGGSPNLQVTLTANFTGAGA